MAFHEHPYLRKVLECASPLALSNGRCGSKSARGLAHSKTLARGNSGVRITPTSSRTRASLHCSRSADIPVRSKPRMTSRCALSPSPFFHRTLPRTGMSALRFGGCAGMRLPRTARVVASMVTLVTLVCSGSLRAQSLLTQKPDDPGAVVVTPDQFPVKADGVADDTDALQQAMNRGAAASC